MEKIIIGKKFNLLRELTEYPLFFVILIIAIVIIIFFLILIKNPHILSSMLSVFKKKSDAQENKQDKNKKTDTNSANLQEQHESCLKKIEHLLENDSQERYTWQQDTCDRLECIENNINKLISIVAKHDKTIIQTSRETLENRLFSESIAPFKRLKAFRMLIALGANGRIKTKGIELIKKHKDTWLDVLDMIMELEIVNQNYYNDVINEIEIKIYRNPEMDAI